MTTALAPSTYAQAIFASELSENTRRAYQKGWRSFVDYCSELGLEPLRSDDTVISQWIMHLSGTASKSGVKPLHPGTIGLYKSGVNKAFELADLPSPCNTPLVRATMKVCRRDSGQPTREVSPLREFQIKAMIDMCPSSAIGHRDAAILAIGFAGALRRSEIIGLRYADCRFLDDETDSHARMLLTIRKSKTDQLAKGQIVPIINGVNIMPITRLRRWLETAGHRDGLLFRAMKRGGAIRSNGNGLHTSDIPRIVKHYASLIGCDARTISGHSLRAGFVTSAAVHQARVDKIMEITRHKSIDTVMRYTRDANQFEAHAGEGFL